MIDVRHALRSHLVFAEARYARAADLVNDPELVQHYADTAQRLARLSAAVDGIPPAMVRQTEQLAVTVGGGGFDAALTGCVESIGRHSFPESAAELLGAVNMLLRFAEFRLAGD